MLYLKNGFINQANFLNADNDAIILVRLTSDSLTYPTI